MKKVVSFIILILAILGICIFTGYTLTHKGIREGVQQNPLKKIEKVTSNVSNERATDVYNVYLNRIKHKLKVEYVYKEGKVELDFYFDGVKIFNDVVFESEDQSIEEILANSLFENIKIDETKLQILESEDNYYLLIQILYHLAGEKEYYYIYDSEGKLLNEEGILVYDSKTEYVSSEDTILDIFYSNELQIMAKVENNQIYAIEAKTDKEEMILEEYIYQIHDGKLEKNLIETYREIKIKENDKKKS